MIYEILIGLVFVAFLTGYWLREVLDTMRRIVNGLDGLRTSQEKDKKPSTSFAEPMTRQEVIALLEQEKIDLLNNR